MQALKQIGLIPELSVLHNGFWENDKVWILWSRRVPDIADDMNDAMVDDLASWSNEDTSFSHPAFGFIKHIDLPIQLIINLAGE